MPRESNIVTRIKERIKAAEAKLPKLDETIDNLQDSLARATLERTALVAGIAADEELISHSAPKKPRTRKELPAKTLGDQLDQANTRKGE